jgi:hypothetical protein
MQKGDADAVGCGPRSADQEGASGFPPLSTPQGFFLPVALSFACSLLVVACDLVIAPCYGRSLVSCNFFLGLTLIFLIKRPLVHVASMLAVTLVSQIAVSPVQFRLACVSSIVIEQMLAFLHCSSFLSPLSIVSVGVGFQAVH